MSASAFRRPFSRLAPTSTLQEIERAFLDANPWLTPDMISITCRKAHLLDIRVFFGRDLSPRNCGVNEDQRRLCAAPKVVVPPPAQR
ncbi:MAG TPA: hypothetical protein VFO09_01135 [Methyloceanibacter sp.]|nr:hypothetical protein [Methyloceanibacter sp.]